MKRSRRGPQEEADEARADPGARLRGGRRSAARALPDVRDGLTRLERVILFELRRLRVDLGRESVPTVMLYGRVVERIDVSEGELQAALRRLAGR